MSEATRSAALAHAVATHGGDGHEVVLKAAKAFDAFIAGTTADKPAATVSTPSKSAAAAATKPPATKPAATTKKPAVSEEEVVARANKKAAAEAEAEPEAEASEGMTLEQVEGLIADLLGANLRKQAVALLAEFGAKSASGVPEDDRAAFAEKAQDLLLGG
jgi:hypothetical protein